MQETHNVTRRLLTNGSVSVEVELPWPSRELSPNSRGHWAKLAKAKKAYRARCRLIGTEAGVGLVPAGSEAVAVHLDFFPPDRRHRDEDNMLAAMKSGLDGLADAMGVDDSRWKLTHEVWREPVLGGKVLVTVSAGSRA